MLFLRSFLWIQRSKKNSTEGSNGCSSRVKSTQNLSRSTSLEMNGYLQRAIHILNLRLQSFLLPQRAEISTQCTLKAFLSSQRTAKCNSMVELFASTGRGFDSSIIAIFSFASTGKCNSMVEFFASTGRDFDSSIITIFSFASTGKCNLMVELFASTGRDFDSSIKFNTPTCEEYCEWFPSCGSEVAFTFNIKQVCFKFSSVISRDQQAAVGSLLRIEAFLSNNSLLRKKLSPFSKTWSISWHLHSRIGKNCSYNRAARHIKISCLPWESSLNRSWPWWILPQPIKDNLLSLTNLEWPQRWRRKRASNFHVHSEDAHFTGVPDNTNSPGSQEPRISKTESTAHVSDLTSDKFCRFRPIVQNSVLPRYGSPAIMFKLLVSFLIHCIYKGIRMKLEFVIKILMFLLYINKVSSILVCLKWEWGVRCTGVLPLPNCR